MCDDPKVCYENTFEGSCTQQPRYPASCSTLPPLSCVGMPTCKYQCVRVTPESGAGCAGQPYTSFRPYLNPFGMLKHQEQTVCTAAAGNNRYGFKGNDPSNGDYNPGGNNPSNGWPNSGANGCGPQPLQNADYDSITSGLQLAGNSNQAVLMSRTRVASSRLLGGSGCAGCYKYSANMAGGPCGKMRSVPNPLALPPTLRLM